MITQEEIEALESSLVCLQCGHKEILHIDYGFQEQCRVLDCMCNKCIIEGDYCIWNALYLPTITKGF